jgi:ribosomal-protein-alanine N-acetyltransferase
MLPRAVTPTNPNREQLFEEFPALSTPRLHLRRFSTGDVDAIFSLRSNPEVCRHALEHPYQDPAEAAKFIHETSQYFEKRARLNWGITRRGEGRVIGHICLHTLSFHSRRAELGFDLASQHWRKGYMSEALVGVLDFAFEQGFHKVCAQAITANTACRAMLLRAGFQCEGLLRQHVFWNERFYDIDFFSMLATEFANGTPAVV